MSRVKNKRHNSSLDNNQTQEQTQESDMGETHLSSVVVNAIKETSTSNTTPAGMVTSLDTKSKKKNKKNKKKSDSELTESGDGTPEDILFSSKVYEKQKLREFWLQLSDEDRKSIVRMERDDVLRKMKEQQKMSCSCHTCGKKKIRNPLDEELEILYDAYYEELENFVNDQGPRRVGSRMNPKGEIVCQADHQGDFHQIKGGGFFNVGEDFLKNDGQRFLSLMEELASRKIRQIETEQDKNTEFNSDEEEWDDVYEDEDDEEEDEEDDNFNEQNFLEGNKMVQLFAAKLFEQRVLTAYREKIAQERQRRLLEELEEEERAKKQKDEEKERKKQQKRALKKQKEEEKLAAEKKKRQEIEELERKQLESERKKKEAEEIKKEKERLRVEELERIQREAEEKKREKELKKQRLAQEKKLEKERKELEAKLAKEKEDQERLQRRKEKEERLKQAKKERKERKEKTKQLMAETPILSNVSSPSNLASNAPSTMPSNVPSSVYSEKVPSVFTIPQHPVIPTCSTSSPPILVASQSINHSNRISPTDTFNQSLFLIPASHHHLPKNPPGLTPPPSLGVLSSSSMSNPMTSSMSSGMTPMSMNSMNSMSNSTLYNTLKNGNANGHAVTDSFSKKVGIIGEKLHVPHTTTTSGRDPMDELDSSSIDELTLRLSGLYDDSDDVVIGSSSLGGEIFSDKLQQQGNIWETSNPSGLSINTTPNTMPSPSLNGGFDGSSLWGNTSNGMMNAIPQVLTHQQFVQMQKSKAAAPIPFVNSYPFHPNPQEQHRVVDPLQPPISTTSSNTWTNTRYF